jgi:serine phosphatase RsbU (regulator of sigma subunit)
VEGNTLRSLAWHGGLGPPGDVFEVVPLDSDLPGADVVRTGRPLRLRNLDEITASFPRLADYYPSQRALHIHPIVIGARVLGVLGLTFAGNGVEESEQVAFVQALADALAQALDRTQALARAQARADRLRLVADASLALNQSLDVKDTLDAVTHVLVPGLADWAIVQVLRNGKLENASVHHPDPAKLQWANSVEGRWPVDMSAPRGAPAVLRTGQSELYAEISDELIAAGAVDDEHLAALRALGIRSVLIVPLTGRSGPVGALTLIYAESGRRYGPDDLPLVEDIARRAAFAIETAETFRQQSGRLADVVRVADAAQRAILSEIPARIGPLLLSSAYRSSAREATVGGDLFEAVPYRGGARVLIGDVRGKGLSAIRTASLVLGAARAAAEDVEDLTEVMTTVDRRLRRHLGDEDFVTACIVEIATDGSYRVASAGHPAPLLVRAGVTGICEVPPSLPLGLGAAPAVVDGHLAPGDRLVLFTDGLLEARDENRAFVPLERLAPAMAAGRLDDAVEGLVRRLTSAASRLDDDLAVLAVEYTGIPTQPGAVEDVAPAQFESP